MALGSTQPLTEMSTRCISWGERRSVRKADSLTTISMPLSWNLGNLNFLEPSGPLQASNGTALPLPLHTCKYEYRIQILYWTNYLVLLSPRAENTFHVSWSLLTCQEMAVRHSSVHLLWRSHAFLFTLTANVCLCRGNKMPIWVTSGGKGSSLFQRY